MQANDHDISLILLACTSQALTDLMLTVILEQIIWLDTAPSATEKILVLKACFSKG